MPDEEKLVSHYRLKTLLRKDGFGAVYAAEDTRDQKECILRVIELDQDTLRRITGRMRAHSQRDHPLIEQIRQRMKRIAELKNSHILPVIEFGEEHIQGNNDIIFYMVSPYEKESLLFYWSEHTSSATLISLEIVIEFISQAAEALYYVHRRGLIHQYVRLSSFMLRSSTRSRRLHLYLTDFWFADISTAILEQGQVAQDLSVYLAAEQLTGKAVFASDQYALAILAYELLLGHRLSGVDISLGLYERFMRQRAASGIEVSAAELELARRIDLVLVRALAENASARYQNIDEFASTFKAIAAGESVDLLEDTTKLPALGHRAGPRGAEVAAFAGAAGVLAAGEVVEEFTETQEEIEVEGGRTRHPSLHKTVLTSEGMEVVEASAGAGAIEETVISEQQAVSSETTGGETIVAEEETLTVVKEEQTGASAGTAGAAGFVAGLAAGELLQRVTDIAEERTLLVGNSAAAFAAGEATQREADLAEEQTLRAESATAAAAGLVAGEAIQREADLAEEQRLRGELAEERTLRAESTAAAAAAGLIAGEAIQREVDLSEERTEVRESSAAAGAAAGLVAGEVLAQEADISQEQTQIIAGGGSATGEVASSTLSEQETDISEENTRIIPAAGGALLVGVAGLAAGGLASEFEATELAGGTASSAAAAATGDIEATQKAGGVAATGAAGGVIAAGGGIEATQRAGGVAAAGGLSAVEESAAAAGLAGATLAAGGTAARGSTQAGSGVIGGGVIGGGVIGGGVLPPPARRRPRRRRILLIAAILAVLLVVIFGGIGAVFAFNQVRAQSSTATVTLTLESHTIQNTYLVTATTSTTITQGQVQASLLTQTASQSKGGQATGYYQGAQSRGFIRFHNSSTGCGCPIIIPAGTAFTGNSGVTVVTDETASVAALCNVTVHAHAVVSGPGGNIPTGDIHANFNSHISATNPFAFSGGQPGQSNALIQQSDIDQVAKSLSAQVIQSAQSGIQSQLKGNQHLFADPTCQTKVKSDHSAGEFASRFNVTVTANCSAEAYDYDAAVQIITQQIQTEASSFSSDQSFQFDGKLQTTITNATVTDAKTGTIQLAIKAVGKWVHKLTSHLESLIAKKSVSEARAILMLAGASNVEISVSGPDPNTLPSDSSKITIIVKS
ncbi:MAG TPA: hypothetical protein VF458_11575 [Ktedonobacteraceae bacterium]